MENFYKFLKNLNTKLIIFVFLKHIKNELVEITWSSGDVFCDLNFFAKNRQTAQLSCLLITEYNFVKELVVLVQKNEL